MEREAVETALERLQPCCPRCSRSAWYEPRRNDGSRVWFSEMNSYEKTMRFEQSCECGTKYDAQFYRVQERGGGR